MYGKQLFLKEKPAFKGADNDKNAYSGKDYDENKVFKPNPCQ